MPIPQEQWLTIKTALDSVYTDVRGGLLEDDFYIRLNEQLRDKTFDGKLWTALNNNISTIYRIIKYDESKDNAFKTIQSMLTVECETPLRTTRLVAANKSSPYN